MIISIIDRLHKLFQEIYKIEGFKFNGIDYQLIYEYFDLSLKGILSICNPQEIGCSISDEKSLDIFVKYNDYSIFYNMFFDEVTKSCEVWLDIYNNHKSICAFDGNIDDSLNILKKIIQ